MQPDPQNTVRGDSFSFEINGQLHTKQGRYARGRAILGDAGFNPADQYVLILLGPHGASSLGLDEDADLGAAGGAHFRAFKSDRIFRFTIEERGGEWGQALINEADLRIIARADRQQVIVLERDNQADLVIDDGADVSLENAGAERFALKVRALVMVKVNEKPVQLHRGWQTGLSIKTAAIAQHVKIKLDFTLNLEREGEDKVIGDNDRIFVRGGECFDAIDNHEDS